MKVENKGGIGNPYHSDTDGEFVSAEESGVKEEEVQETNALPAEPKDEDDVFDFGLGESAPEDEAYDMFFGEDSVDDLLEDKDEEDDDFLSNLAREIDVSEEVQNMTDEEISTNLNAIKSQYDLDPEKLKSATADELRTLQQAIKDIYDSNHNQELINLNNKQFSGIWLFAVKPQDYKEYSKKGPDGKSRLEKKIEYFNSESYTKPDKQAKLDTINAFIEAGKAYEKLSKELNDKTLAATVCVDAFKDENSLYSNARKKNALWVKGGYSEALKYFKERGEQLFNYLQQFLPESASALVEYTQSYSSITRPLRKLKYESGVSLKKKTFLNNVKNMTEGLDKCESAIDCWVQRGTGQIAISDTFTLDGLTSESEVKSLVGTTFKDQSFMSCGTGKGTGFSGNVIMNIYCPKGTKMLYIAPYSHYKSENETIINRGYSYRITKAEKKNGIVYIDCDCILGSDADRYDYNTVAELGKTYL